MPSSGCGETPSGSRSATSRRRLLHGLRQLADGLLAVALAPGCAACGRPLVSPTAGPVCDDCWSSIPPLLPPLCLRCGDPLPSWRAISIAAETCPRCRRQASSLDRCRAIGDYDGSLRAIVHALKYQECRSLAKRLATLMRGCGEVALDGADVAVPVPLHPRRLRARGFNQAADLADHLGLPVLEALRRRRATPSQTDLPAARRHANVRDAFEMRRGRQVAGLRIVLVDDVCTTGATLEACARVLRQAGAREITALTAARVVSRPPAARLR
jgi:ComF family protein